MLELASRRVLQALRLFSLLRPPWALRRVLRRLWLARPGSAGLSSGALQGRPCKVARRLHAKEIIVIATIVVVNIVLILSVVIVVEAKIGQVILI